MQRVGLKNNDIIRYLIMSYQLYPNRNSSYFDAVLVNWCESLMFGSVDINTAVKHIGDFTELSVLISDIKSAHIVITEILLNKVNEPIINITYDSVVDNNTLFNATVGRCDNVA